MIHLLEQAEANDEALTCLYLPAVDWDPENVERLGRALVHNTHVHTLDIGQFCKRIGASASVGLLRRLRDNESVTTLSLGLAGGVGHVCAGPVGEWLAKPRSKLVTVGLRNARIGHEGLASLLKPLLDAPNARSALTSLDLTGNHLNQRSADLLAELMMKGAALLSIGLQGNRLGAAGAKSLAHGCVRHAASLHTLNLSQNRVGPTGAEDLAAVLPETVVTRLDLSSNGIGLQGGAAIAVLLRDPGCQLETLDLSHNQLDACSAALADSLRHNRSLTSVDLRLEEFSDGALAEIVHGVAGNVALAKLNLGLNRVRTKSAEALRELFVQNQCLRSLSLQECDIEADDFETITTGLKTNTTLTTLVILQNRLRLRGASLMAEALSFGVCRLTCLDMSLNQLGSEGLQAVAGGLGRLVTLKLRDNDMGSSGLKAFVDALEDNYTLTSLDLFRNGMGDEGGQILHDMLLRNYRLCELDIRFNGSGEEDVNGIVRLLARNGELPAFWRALALVTMKSEAPWVIFAINTLGGDIVFRRCIFFFLLPG